MPLSPQYPLTTDSATKTVGRELPRDTFASARTSGRRLVYIALAIIPMALLGLLSPMPRATQTRLGGSIFDLLHVPAFTILTLLAILLAERYFSRTMMTRVLITLAVIAAGGCIEFIQASVGRSASTHDLIANAAGAVTALLLRFSFGGESVAKRLTRVAAIVVFLVASIGPILSILDVIRQQRNKELLATFASHTELDRWYFHSAKIERIRNPFSSLREVRGALRATLFPSEYPMIQLQQMNSRWTGYNTLSFDIGRPASDPPVPLKLQLRIRAWGKPSRTGDSYYRIIELEPGERRKVEIPIREIRAADGTGTLNLANIRFIEFGALELHEPATFELANVRLN